MITGANGFCGRRLAKRLREAGGAHVVGTGRQRESVAGDLLDDYVSINLTSPVDTSRLLRRTQPDLVFHLAGTRTRSSQEMQQCNVDGTRNLLSAISEHCPDSRTLLIGSAAEYGQVTNSELPIRETHVCRPVGQYALTKHRATLIGLEYAARGQHVTVARPFNIVGAGMSSGLFLADVLARLDQSMQAGVDPCIRVGNLEPKRDFIAVEDVVDAYVKLLQGPTSGEVYNICSGTAISMRYVLQLLLEHTPCPVRLEIDPELGNAGDVSVSYGSFAKAAHAIDFRPTRKLADAISDAWEYYFGGQSK